MKKCPKCGKLNNSQAKFCKYCGTKLPKSTVPNKNKANVKHKTSHKFNNNTKKCPRCGTQNMKQAKFCKKCGYKFGTKVVHTKQNQSQRPKVHKQVHRPQSHTQPQPTMRTQHRHMTQGRMSHESNINFGAYFKWLGSTLANPMKAVTSHTYFGLISLIAMAVLLWIANILSTGSEIIGNELSGLTVKYLPLQIIASNEGNAQTPLGYLVLSACFIFIPVAISYACEYLLLKQHQSFFNFCNRFARLINISLIWTLLLIFSIVISQSTLVVIFSTLISITMVLGVFASLTNEKAKKVVNSFYMSMCVLFINYIGLALIATILGLILK